MMPDIHEHLAREHRQTLLREAEQQRRLAKVHNALPPPSSHRLTARLGRYLVFLGTRLQGAQAVAGTAHWTSRVPSRRHP